MRGLIVSLLLTVSLHSAEPLNNTWPQWRGPQRDGISPGNSWPDKLDGLKQRWQVKELGSSYSGPIVTDKYVFTTETIDKKMESVSCLDRQTGKEIWRKEWSGSMTVPFFANRNGSWIRSTPAYDGEALYVGGIRDVLVCLEAADGKERWRVDFVKDFESPLPAFGFVCSPLVDETGVYVQAGSCFTKLDKKTGKPLWKVLKEGDAMMGSAFASPTFATINGQQQILVQTRTRLAGVDAAKGTVLWEKAIPSFRGMNILTPVPIGDSVFTSTYGGNTRLITLKNNDKQILSDDAWTFKYEGNMTTPVVVDGYVYLFGKDRRFLCLNAKTGAEQWRTEERFGEYWNLVARRDKILALDNRGKLFLIKANPNKFEVLDQKDISKSETWAHLAVVGDELFIRDLNALTAYEWKATK